MAKVRLSSPEVAEGERDTYSQAFRVGDFIFINGQIGCNASGTLVGPDIGDEIRQAFSNLRSLVLAGGATMDDVIKLNVYVTDMAYRPAVVAIRREFFRNDFPCSTLVAVSALAFGARFEVDGVAYRAPNPTAVSPPGSTPAPAGRRDSWLELSWSALEAWMRARPSPAVLLPVGAVEQHGPFLPLGTDVIIAEQIAESIAAELEVMIAPAVAIAASDAHLGFPGTLSLGKPLLRDALARLCLQLLGRDRLGITYRKADFAKVFLLSAHGGNARVLDDLAGLDGVHVLPGWWELAETREAIAGRGIIEGAHADETETSLLLHYGYAIVLPELPFLLPEESNDADADRPDTRAISASGILAPGLYAPSADCGRALHEAAVRGYRRLLEADGLRARSGRVA